MSILMVPTRPTPKGDGRNRRRDGLDVSAALFDGLCLSALLWLAILMMAR